MIGQKIQFISRVQTLYKYTEKNYRCIKILSILMLVVPRIINIDCDSKIIIININLTSNL